MYQPRFYRDWRNKELKSFQVAYKETDLLIMAAQEKPDICFQLVKRLRQLLDNYIEDNPLFLRSLQPVEVHTEAPQEIREMAEKSALVGVGPMAAVAGLFAERVGQQVLSYSEEVIVENGGDIFLAVKKGCMIGIFAGEHSPFSDKLALKIPDSQSVLGVCTSSGTLGPSYSRGKADLVTVISSSTILADAAATAIANKVQEKTDINKAIKWAQGIEGLNGVIIIKDDQIGIWGEVEIVKR